MLPQRIEHGMGGSHNKIGGRTMGWRDLMTGRAMDSIGKRATTEAPHLRDRLGICQWFHYEDYDAVRRAVTLLRELNVRHLRTGISWADFHRERGRPWYDWMMTTLREFDVLLSIWHTPPSISEGNTCASPPRRLRDYSDFILQVIDCYRECFSALELWNEPNNRLKWDFQRFDPEPVRKINLLPPRRQLQCRSAIVPSLASPRTR
jgi:hypothetical protein